ncbi:MAG: urate hydroxylase PuuD [Acidobacteriota bacterium]
MTWPSDWQTNVTFLLRWGHLLAGITWIGMLYFFNLVNVQFQKEIDAAVKSKINPPLLTRSLWWFRWGAMGTWLTGFLYYIIIAGTEKPGHKILAVFLVVWVIAFLILSLVYRMAVRGGALKDGRVVAVLVAVVIAAAAYVVGCYGRSWGGSNRSLSILIGGGIGTVMFMNVWMIIWPLQKKIIAATIAAASGTPAPADQALWARRAFLASRSNTWLSVPMLFFMAAASHFPIFSTLSP